MSEENKDELYPVRTLHEFLYEIKKEWGKLKKGSLISISISSLLFVAFILVLIRTIKNSMEISDIILELLLGAFLVYSIYLMFHQYRFFRKWDSRINRLNNIEEQLMPELSDKKQE